MSATYNIAQKGVTKPWPLSFVEPGGHVSKAEQRPGDVVFYEGASGMHGREVPLDGDEFVSIYFHWRPKNWESRLVNLPHRTFGELVDVKERPPKEHYSKGSLRALTDGECPAEGSDTHAAAGLADLWRPAHTYPVQVFNPEGYTEEMVHDRISKAGAASGEEVVKTAAGLVQRLGLFDYVALHARSIEPSHDIVSPDVVLARWVGFLQPGTKLFVAGDGAERYRTHGLAQPLGIDIVTMPAGSARNEEAEVLICAHARIFIGAGDRAGLTLTTQDMRKKVSAPSTVELYHQDTVKASRDEVRAEDVGKELREWRLHQAHEF